MSDIPEWALNAAKGMIPAFLFIKASDARRVHERVARALAVPKDNLRDSEGRDRSDPVPWILSLLRNESALYFESSRTLDASGNTTGGGHDAAASSALARMANEIERVCAIPKASRPTPQREG